MTVTEKQLQNLKKGKKFSENTAEKQRRIASNGGKASGDRKSVV